MKLYIKNMVCKRCIMYVQEVLIKNKIGFKCVELGEAETLEEISKEKYAAIEKDLKASGFELLSDSKTILIEKIKKVIIEMIHYFEERPIVNYSEYIATKLNHDYHSLSTLFSKIKGMTIEQYIIAQKIEKVKEFLSYDDLTLTEIAYKLNYSSVAHLSKQFKKVTGLSPTFFKSSNSSKRKSLDDI
ncbi:MAG: helix-turn-helix transcriptional regulator [Ignavibacteria bacterium]|nr:helix-turn-helix transcriptional regulator [Ignavibacteria bacterium]